MKAIIASFFFFNDIWRKKPLQTVTAKLETLLNGWHRYQQQTHVYLEGLL